MKKIILSIVLIISSFAVQSRELLIDRDIIGEWYTLSLNNGIYEKLNGEGRVRFYANKTFQILSGKNTVVPGCSSDCTGAMGTWSIENGLILMMQLDGIDPGSSLPWLKGWGFVMVNEGKYITLTRAMSQTLMKKISR